MAKGTFLAHNVAWAVLGEKMNHRSQASANSNSVSSLASIRKKAVAPKQMAGAGLTRMS